MRVYRREMRIRNMDKKERERPPNYLDIEVISGDFTENRTKVKRLLWDEIC